MSTTRCFALAIELGAVGAFEPADVPRVLDDGHLHPETDPKEGNPVLARVLDRLNLALGAAVAEAAWHQDRVVLAQARLEVSAFELFAVDVVEVELHVALERGVHQGLVQRLVRVAQVHVLADERNRHVPSAGSHVAVDRSTPNRKVRVARPDVEPLGEQAIEPLLVERQRKLVDHFTSGAAITA